MKVQGQRGGGGVAVPAWAGPPTWCAPPLAAHAANGCTPGGGSATKDGGMVGNAVVTEERELYIYS